MTYSHRFGDEPTEPVPHAPGSEIEEQMPWGNTPPADLTGMGLVEAVAAYRARLPENPTLTVVPEIEPTIEDPHRNNFVPPRSLPMHHPNNK